LKIIGIGLSSIGPLDVNSGLLLNPPNFHGVEMLDLGKLISCHFSQPLFIDNDMNAAAWAEHLYGAARGLQHSVYLGLTNGIGAGIIAYGRVFQGSAGYGGEVGHMCVQMDGPVCHCGRRGCLEAYISLPVLMKKTGLSSLDELLSRACEADYKLLWQPEYIEALKTGLINIVNIFDPDIVLLGHDGAALTRDFLPELEQSVNDGIFQKRARAVKLTLADFKDQAPLIGSAALVFQAVFRGDLQP
jgi:predicted NBD/HSP70 family sugar kinase